MPLEAATRKVVESPPRTLLIDPTPFGGSNATGELKVSYFKGFGEESLLHLCAGAAGQLRLAKGGVFSSTNGSAQPDSQSLVDQCRSFEPDLILYRPVPDPPELHRAAMRLIRELGRPWVIWLMDDWPEQLRAQDEARFVRMDCDLRELLRGAAKRFVISEGMAEGFGERYGVSFDIFRNGALADEWLPIKRRLADGNIRIRYAGSLAPHTTRDSVLEVAKLVAELAASMPISLEIRSQGLWYRAEKHKYAGLKGITISAADLTPADYRQWLADADILLVAYNFDEETTRYLRFSFGNKIPEYLASGAAVLAYGPKDLATIKFLANTNAAIVVGEQDRAALRRAIESLATDASARARLGEQGRRLAFSKLDLDRQRVSFVADLRAAAQLAGAESPSTLAFSTRPFSRDEQAQIDECRLIFEAVGSEPNRVMIDVGAHYGSSLARFAEAGWSVYAFEPDPRNRERLVKSHGGKSTVTISEEAVSDVAGEVVPLYASDESSGISGLKAFRESHREVARVRTTTLSEIVARHGLARIDFLKVDVEGLELAVLRGLDFDRVKPLTILAEFEDLKTDGVVRASRDMATFLVDRGYSVYVSEWHPIERYGARHSFRRMQEYPCSIPSSSWGNLLAFRTNPEPALLGRAIRAAVDRPVTFVGEAESKVAANSRPMDAASGRASESARSGSVGAAVGVKPASGATARSQGPRSRSKMDLVRRASAIWANWTRPMRRRPIISAFLSVAAVTLLTFPLGRPFLSALATPEFIVALLVANIVLTALVARIVRKSLISRINDFAARSDDELRRSEARQQSLIKGQLQDLEGRIVAALRTLSPAGLPDSDELAAKIAERLAEAHRPHTPADNVTESREVGKADAVAGRADLHAAHWNGANGSSDIQTPLSSPAQEAASENRHGEVEPRSASDKQPRLYD